MFAQESILFRLMQGYLEKVIVDFSDDDLTKPTPGAVNPPAYILGHLAICNDFALQLLGKPTVCPRAWMAAFGPGSSPDAMKIPYPSRGELMDAIRRGHELVLAAVVEADPVSLAAPHTVAIFAGTPIQTNGDVVALLMTTHFSLHIGQLSLMRRQTGRPPLF